MNSFIVFSALGSVLALVFAVLMGKRALSADGGYHGGAADFQFIQCHL